MCAEQLCNAWPVPGYSGFKGGEKRLAGGRCIDGRQVRPELLPRVVSVLAGVHETRVLDGECRGPDALIACTGKFRMPVANLLHGRSGPVGPDGEQTASPVLVILRVADTDVGAFRHGDSVSPNNPAGWETWLDS